MAATITKQKPADKLGRACNVLEYLDLATIGRQSVDRTASVIRGVKVLSKHSTNRHGMPGVDGTLYELPVHEQLKDLIEAGSVNVNIGHPSRTDPDAERDPRDGNGTLFNPQVVNEETFADWQLIPSHVMTANILDSAENERLHGQYALSINARCYGEPRNGRYCVSEFQSPFVRSVDLVRKGGANKNIFESQEPTMKNPKPFGEIVAALIAKPTASTPKNLGKRWADVLEMYEDMGETKVDMPAEAAEVEELDWKAHLGNLLKSIATDAEMGPDEIRKKIAAALKCLDDAEGDADVPEGDADADADAPAAADKMESKERDELKSLRLEKNVRDICESLEYPFDFGLCKKLEKLSDIQRVQEIAKLKKAKKSASGGPRTASGRDVIESRATGGTAMNFDDRSPEARDKRLASLGSR